MILQQFFQFYLEKVSPQVKKEILDFLPSGTERDAHNLALMFQRSDRDALEFLVKFHFYLEELRKSDPFNCIVFNQSENVCFPFFIGYIWNRISSELRREVMEATGGRDFDQVVDNLRASREMRNWFRSRITPILTQADLFALNDIIALQNFGSGGEYSFLSLVLPEVKEVKGRVLDAGCGAGFSSLVMSQYADVRGIDACGIRVSRARGLAELVKKQDLDFFATALKLMETELGSFVGEVQFPKAEEILFGQIGEVDFQQGSLDDLPFGENQFDAVVCLDVLEHTYNPGAVVKQFAKVAKTGGLVYITAPNSCGEMYQRAEEEAQGSAFPALLHMHHFEPDSLTELFASSGFEPVEVRPFDYISREEFVRITGCEGVVAPSLMREDSTEVPMQIFAVYRKGGRS